MRYLNWFIIVLRHLHIFTFILKLILVSKLSICLSVYLCPVSIHLSQLALCGNNLRQPDY